jgi:hypothetical protein
VHHPGRIRVCIYDAYVRVDRSCIALHDGEVLRRHGAHDGYYVLMPVMHMMTTFQCRNGKGVFFTFAGRVGPGETSAGGDEMGRGRRRG